MAETYKVTIGAFGIILDEKDQVLLCHRLDYDLWTLPGGRLEAGESPWQACVREVEEEVGLLVQVDRLIGIYSIPERSDIVFAFTCTIEGGELTTSDEADQIEYFALPEIPRNTSPKQVERIKDALNRYTEPVLKVQTGPSSIELLRQGKL